MIEEENLIFNDFLCLWSMDGVIIVHHAARSIRVLKMEQRERKLGLLSSS